MINVGVQGIAGSFSEAAARHYLMQQQVRNYQLDYLVDSDHVLDAVAKKRCEYGIIAVENSIGGVVYESLYALANHNCRIHAFFSIRVVQNLLKKPETDKTMIRQVYSHQQALLQCKQYLRNNFPKAALIEARDTAYAAQQLANNVLPEHSAVIGNAACAALYGLEIMEENISDMKDNQTLFIAAMSREQAE